MIQLICDRCRTEIPGSTVNHHLKAEMGWDLCAQCRNLLTQWMKPCRECGHLLEDHLGLQCGADLGDGAQCDCDDVSTWVVAE